MLDRRPEPFQCKSQPALPGTIHLTSWRAFVSRNFDVGITAASAEHGGGTTETWFFNAIKDKVSEGDLADITWTAFPRELQVKFPDDGPERWGRADSDRSLQEEYCEWEVVKKDGLLESAVFTTETPDYYNFLAFSDKALLLELYHKFVSSAVKIEDLIVNGSYDDANKWNLPRDGSGSIVHMGGNIFNTLGAAINLSAQATWPSVDANGAPITSEQELIACRRFGKAARHSDPHIGAQINSLVRNGKKVSFPGPVGLYIHKIDLTGFEMPNDEDPEELFIVERGSDDFKMRVKVQAPENANYSLSDVLVDGEPLEFGGQIAEKIRIRIRGMAIDAPKQAPEIPCDNPQLLFTPMKMTRQAITI